jgi:heme/copper-type cytochrome/quinol oxidase subunit 4
VDEEEKDEESGSEFMSDVIGYGLMAVLTLIAIGLVIWFG